MPPPTHMVTMPHFAPPLAFDQDVTSHAGARHAVGLADRKLRRR
jgi:hypothetical protein